MIDVAHLSRTESDRASGWPLATRIAFRFGCAYLALGLLQVLLFAVPGLSWLGEWERRGWMAVAAWTARHVLRIATDLDFHSLGTGSGDTMIAYVMALCTLSFATVMATVWSVADRQRRAYPVLLQWLRVGVRYSLAWSMLGYGMAKVFQGQFYFPSLDQLLEPYEQSSPMGLLWMFMGYSRPYTFFCGAIESIGGLLLFWRRTTTLGALIAAAGMTNVVMLNFSYDVPVKLNSSHLLLMAVFLLLPDLRRLARMFILNRPIDPTPLGTPFSTVWRNRAALVLKVIVIGGTLWDATSPQIQAMREPLPPKPALYGIYDVDSFTLNGEARPPVAMDGKRWRRVIINEYGEISVQTMDEAMIRFRVREVDAKKTFELSTNFNPFEKVVLTYRQPDPNQLVLEGNYYGEAVNVLLRKVPPPPFLLRDRGFHWISEFPYNR